MGRAQEAEQCRRQASSPSAPWSSLPLLRFEPRRRPVFPSWPFLPSATSPSRSSSCIRSKSRRARASMRGAPSISPARVPYGLRWPAIGWRPLGREPWMAAHPALEGRSPFCGRFGPPPLTGLLRRWTIGVLAGVVDKWEVVVQPCINLYALVLKAQWVKLLADGRELNLVPLYRNAACSSAISSTAIDRNLRVPNASYTLTANNCIMCSCSSTTWQLDCQPAQGIAPSSCPVAKCGDLFLGNTSTSPASACETTSCSYAGYTNSTSFSILSNLTTTSVCNASGMSPAMQPAHSSASGLGLPARWRWSELFVGIHIVLLFLGFLHRD